MGYMLSGLGPVDVGDGVTINSRNAVATLLNGVYLKYPTSPVKQDDVFENRRAPHLRRDGRRHGQLAWPSSARSSAG